MQGLFINNIKAQDSIYESGKMVHNCLTLSHKFKIDYCEVNIEQRSIPFGYDFYFFNYHPSTMAWMDTSTLKQLPGIVITMVLEVLPNDPFVMCPDNHFHAYCVLDPTIKIKNKKVFPFPRPLETAVITKPYQDNETPIIGSFGFATKGKGFQHVVEAVNKEFEKATVRLNIPFGDYVPESEKYSKFLAQICKDKAKKGINVEVTHDYMSKEQLIDWCSQNTLNCFLYDRNIPGLAATTDQAITAGRPLAVSKNDTFRHILAYLPAYPQWSLKESIQKSAVFVKEMQQDWSPGRFAQQFEKALEVLQKRYPGITKVGQNEEFVIPVRKNNWQFKLSAKYRRYKRLLTMGKIKKIFTSLYLPKHEELI